MESVPDIIEAFGGVAEFGRVIGKRPEHAGAIKARRSIPVRYWPRIVAAARERGLAGVTPDRLMEIHAPKSGDAA